MCVYFPQVLEDRVPFLMGSIKDLQHYVPSSKDSIVSRITTLYQRQWGTYDFIQSRTFNLCSTSSFWQSKMPFFGNIELFLFIKLVVRDCR